MGGYELYHISQVICPTAGAGEDRGCDTQYHSIVEDLAATVKISITAGITCEMKLGNPLQIYFVADNVAVD